MGKLEDLPQVGCPPHKGPATPLYSSGRVQQDTGPTIVYFGETCIFDIIRVFKMFTEFVAGLNLLEIIKRKCLPFIYASNPRFLREYFSRVKHVIFTALLYVPQYGCEMIIKITQSSSA